jgi:hypothetical protein
MMIHIIRDRATSQQVTEMQQMLQTYIKEVADTSKRWSDRVLELSGLLEQ